MITDQKIWEEKLSVLLKEKNIAGMAFAVTNREKLLWEQGFGVTSVEKPWDMVTGKTLFRIASNTKFTVGLCAMILSERGCLSLDDSVREYLPWFTLSDGITVRKLLNHTAGLPKEYTPDGPREEKELEAVLRDTVPSLTLVSDPAENHYLYSNYGVRITALIMEKITGKFFSSLCRELVLDPLGMERSTFDLFEAATYELALPHNRDDEGNPFVEHRFHENATRYAAGGLYSNVHEMTALARVILNDGAPLISKAAWMQMITPYVRINDIRQEGYYGLTLMKRKFNGTVLYGHTGSHPPFYSCIFAEPESGLGIAFTVNTEGGSEFTNHLIPEMFVC